MSSEGKLDVKIPRVRNTEMPYESDILRRLSYLEQRIEKLAIEMYVRGLSTRDVESTLVDDNGKSLLSKSSVSELTNRLNEEYHSFSERDLSGFDIVYLFADGVYESIRNYTNNQTILCAWAICSDGRKILLHLQSATVVGIHACGKSEETWTEFFEGLRSRGLRHPLLVTTDGHKGLMKAVTRVFPRAKRQRCIAHKIRNLMNKLPHHVQQQIKQELHMIYYASDNATAEVLAAQFFEKYAGLYPQMIKSFTDDMKACLVHLEFPSGRRRLIRTTNLIERSFVEEKRRTKIIPQHQNEKGAIAEGMDSQKLVYGVLIRSARRWQRVNMSDLDLTILRNIKKTIVPNEGENGLVSYEVAA